MDEDDTQDGTPIQGSTIGDIDPESATPSDIQEHTAAPISSTQQQQTDAGQAQTQQQTETGTSTSQRK